MGQRSIHYTEQYNGTHVLYAPNQWVWILLHSERPKLCGVLAFLSAIGLSKWTYFLGKQLIFAILCDGNGGQLS